MKKLLVLALIAALILPALSLVSAQDESVTIRFTFWIPTDHAAAVAAFNPLAEAYMAEHPNVTIEYNFIAFGDYDTTIATQLSGDNPPDAGWIVERSGPSYIDAGVLYDLSDTLKSDAAYDYADFSESAMGLWVKGDGVYAIPFSTSPFLTIYNKTLFDQAGLETPDVLVSRGEWTWDALADDAKAIKDATGSWGFVSTDAALFGSTGNAWATMIPLLRAFGTDIFDANNACTMNSDGAVQAFSLLHKMIFDDQSTVPPGSEEVFWSGNVGVTFGQISRLSNLDDAAFEWGVTLMPSGPAGEVYLIGQAALATFNGKNNKHQEIAADFVKYLTSQQGVAMMAPFFPPARMSVLHSPEFLTGNSRVSPEDMENVVAATIAKGSVVSSHKNFPEIDLIGATALDELWMPDTDVKGTLDLYCSLIGPYLKK